MREKVPIVEIFDSIAGEVNGVAQGILCTFIRFYGCNINCSYCDTPQGKSGENFQLFKLSEIVERIEQSPFSYIFFTGGEPLLFQEEIINIVEACPEKVFIIETNGTINIDERLLYVCFFVVDYKLPSSGIQPQKIVCDYTKLSTDDYIKFVISDERDFVYFLNVYDVLHFESACIAISANTSTMSYDKLFALIKKHNVKDVVFNVQLHKLIDFK
jgi:7-carboxy-7-deazaguanine synthase